jgi:hypothetical protein
MTITTTELKTNLNKHLPLASTGDVPIMQYGKIEASPVSVGS